MSVAKSASREQALLTIGAVCEQLKGDFPDISISKIRYLEDQGLIAPQRTRGGTGCSARTTSSGCGRSSACSATSSSRSG